MTIKYLTSKAAIATTATGSSSGRKLAIKKVAIVGAGPAGIATAKHLAARPEFEKIVVFEQQPTVGGVWNYSALASNVNVIPQTNPFSPPDPPVHDPDAAREDEPPVFLSPVYDTLHANTPRELMRFSTDSNFSSEALLFPSRQLIRDYVVDYSRTVASLIKPCMNVESVCLMQSRPGQGDQWSVTARSTVDQANTYTDTFDAVVVASGHYSLPYVPQIRSIGDFHATHPSVIIHSKNYRTANVFRDKTAMVVGNGSSGLDIARQISKVCKGPLLLSVRTPTDPQKLAHTGALEVPQIEEFLPAQRAVRLVSGRIVTDLDVIVMCTGFLYSYSFLPGLGPELLNSTNGKGLHGLYKHLFHIAHPTIVFPGLLTSVVPFPVCEAQASLIAAVWSDNLTLPPSDEMRQWSQSLEEEKKGAELHRFLPGADGIYINELHDWTLQAKNPGRPTPKWGDNEFWQKKNYAEAKLRFEKDGCRARNFDELGLNYQKPLKDLL